MLVGGASVLNEKDPFGYHPSSTVMKIVDVRQLRAKFLYLECSESNHAMET